MSNVHVIIGEDDFLVAEAAKKIIADGVGLEVIDSANSGNQELQFADLAKAKESFLTPPFFDPRKVTWWRDVGFLPGAKKKDAEPPPAADDAGNQVRSIKTALEDFAALLVKSPLPENQHFILSGPKLLATSVFAKRLKAGGAEMIVFETPKSAWRVAEAAASRAEDMAAEMNLKFAPRAAAAFIARVGSDTRSIMSELGKMRDYLGRDSHTIDESAIAEITSEGVGVEPVVWDITDAVAARDLAKALAAVKRFEAENGFAVLVTTVVEKQFRQLAELKDAEAKGKLGEATEGMAPFVAQKLSGALGNWTLNELRIARYRFLKLRERVVSSSGEADALVVTELVQALRRPAGARRK